MRGKSTYFRSPMVEGIRPDKVVHENTYGIFPLFERSNLEKANV
jgi:hypothetical protein